MDKNRRAMKRHFQVIWVYKGLIKNDSQLAMLFTLANLFKVEQMFDDNQELSEIRE